MREIMTMAAIGIAMAAMVPAGWAEAAEIDAVTIAGWRTRAASGDINAAYNLGQAYRQGNGVAEDPAEAEAWYRKAAEQGHALAQSRLGLMLFTSRRRQDSYAWLEKAAAQGEPRAQYVMGNALFNGDDLPRDWPRAYAMMSRAAATGLVPAIRNLATMERLVPAPDRQKGAALAEAMAARETVVPAVRQPAASARAAAALPAPPPVRSVAVAGKGPPASPPSRRPAKAWHVQLGAFAREGAARSYWTTLSAAPALRGQAPLYVSGAGTTRLQLGPFAGRAAAGDMCAAIRKSGAACFPVAP